MTALRQRLIQDLQLRNFSSHTVEAYVRAVAKFSQRYGRSPDQLTGEQVREHLLWMVKERGVSWSLYNQTRCALQFFFRVTLGRDEWFEKLPCAKRPKRLPTVLSAEELRRLFDAAAAEPKHQALLMTLSVPAPIDCLIIDSTQSCPVCGHGRMISGPNLNPIQLRQLLIRLDSS